MERSGGEKRRDANREEKRKEKKGAPATVNCFVRNVFAIFEYYKPSKTEDTQNQTISYTRARRNNGNFILVIGETADCRQYYTTTQT
jgi:hypothetical protein